MEKNIDTSSETLTITVSAPTESCVITQGKDRFSVRLNMPREKLLKLAWECLVCAYKGRSIIIVWSSKGRE